MIIKCDNCGIDFKTKVGQVNKFKTHFCCRKCQGEYKRLKIVGKNFGSWEVLEFEKIDGQRSIFKCKCKDCDKIYSVPSKGLVSNKSTKCKKCSNRKYVGEISGQYFNSLKQRAKKDGIIFEITQVDIWEQFLKQERKCVISGIELTWRDGAFGELGTASVDRKDSTKGYLQDNIQILHKHVNIMKLNHTQDYFIDLCKRIAKNNE